jgi:PHD/YefM family antitoxin component YafN of YafNO toxin-antitoxin module
VNTIHPQYITDEHGKKVSVILPLSEYEQLLEELEELEDIRLYDESKKNDQEAPISFDDYVKQRRSK